MERVCFVARRLYCFDWCDVFVGRAGGREGGEASGKEGTCQEALAFAGMDLESLGSSKKKPTNEATTDHMAAGVAGTGNCR